MSINFETIINIHQPQNINCTGDLSILIQSFDFENYLREELGNNILSENQKTIKFKNCPICGHNNCFVYFKKTKSFFCFGKHGNFGGTIIDYLMRTKNFEKPQAIEYLKYNLSGISRQINTIFDNISKPEILSAQELINLDIPEPYCSIENLIYQGITILAAPPKHGKSWMVMDICLSVAKGENFLGFKTHQSGTLYLTPEDSKNRVKKRLKNILCCQEPPEDFYICTEAITLESHLITILENYLKENPNIKLIVIDTLQKIRGNLCKNQNAYAKDYSDLSQLKIFADKYSICIIIVHHLRKEGKKEEDVFNQISGTNGIFGCADTAIVLKNKKDESTMYIRGRDVEDDELALTFNPQTLKWVFLGNPDEQEKRRILKKYNENNIIRIIREMLDKEKHWEGTMKELKKFLKEKYKCYIQESESQIAKILKEYKDLMLQEDKIEYIPSPRNGSNGKRIHRFKTDCFFTFDEEIEDLFA